MTPQTINHMIKRLFCAAVSIAFAACDFAPSQLEQALQLSGDNRAELESVIAHYDSVGDDEKARAARFLIENMPGNSSLCGDALERFYAGLAEAYDSAGQDHEKLRAFYDSALKAVPWHSLKRVSDLRTMRADYLIRNIDMAFEVRNSPYLKDVSFEEFCETILPYREENETLENWRHEYRREFAYAAEGVDQSSDSALFSLFWNLTQRYSSHNYSKYPAGMPGLKPSFLKRSMLAPCSDFCKMGVFWGRACGVAVARDFIPQWANYPNRHEWNSVSWGGKRLSFMIGERNYLGDHLPKCSNVMTKVFRRRYAFQSPEQVAPAYFNGDVPNFFRNPKMIDVTAEYWPVTDIALDGLSDAPQGTPPFVYLTVFDNKGWNAVAWAHRRGAEAVFKDVAVRPALYLPAYYNEGRYIPAHDPIAVREDGTVDVLSPDTTRLRSVTLTRKYYETRVNLFLRNFYGSVIEVANRADFSDAISFTVPDTVKSNYQSWDISGSYRYVRFLPAPGRDTGLAELEAWDENGAQAQGTVIGNYAGKKPYAKENIADGKELTYAAFKRADPDQWVGLDLGSPTKLSRIGYLSRNDGNFIVEGHEYELFYWSEGQWNSLGKRTGSRKTQAVEYDDVPRGALLLLRNLTKGKEERIFTYEDGRQVWW